MSRPAPRQLGGMSRRCPCPHCDRARNVGAAEALREQAAILDAERQDFAAGLLRLAALQHEHAAGKR